MFALLIALSAAPALAETPGITLDDAVLRAHDAPAAQAGQDAAAAARAAYMAAWPSRLPSLSVSGNVLVYDEAQELTLFQSDEPLDCTGIPDPFGSMCASFGDPIIVRDQVTTSLTVQAAVPITGQIAVDRQVAAAKATMRAGQAGAEAATADAELSAREAWFGAAQADNQLAIALAQEQSLEQRAKVADAAYAAGTLTRNDQLLVHISLAQAQQAVAQLQGYQAATYAQLGAATGNGGTPLRPLGFSEAAPRPAPELDGLVDRALRDRPQVVALREQVAAARATASAASWGRLPGISGIAAYQHTTGQGAFGSPDTAYVGASLSWTALAWGKAAANVHAASAQADQLQHQLDALEAGVRVDVQNRLVALQTAASSYAIAEDTVKQASENLSIQERRQQVGSGTMVEVLDAQTALVRAQSTRMSALFDARRAEAALAHAIGGDPWAG